MSLSAIILIAMGGALAVEGVLWAIFPGKMREAYEETFRIVNDNILHIVGLISVAIGVALIAAGAKLTGI